MDDTDRNPIRGPREDEFRRRLKDLGYLENPLDKFFIGGSHGRTGVLVANLKIAAKVGVLGGVFLGVVTSLSLALLSPAMAPDLAAMAKLAGYFSAIFTVLFAALELAICLAVTVLGRVFRRLFTRTEMIALYSGVFAGLAVLVYGTLWWWAGSSGGVLLSGRAVAAFAVIAILAAGAGLLTRVAVTALLALLGGADLAARGKGRATKLYFVILVCGILIFTGYRVATARTVPTTPSAYDMPASPLSVTIVAVDGASLDFLDLAREKGAVPNLDAFARKAFVAEVASPPLHVNPAVWTTVATGVEPSKHGVTSYSAQEIPGLGFYIKDRTGFGLYDALLAALPAVGLSERAPLERRSTAFPAVWDIVARKGPLSGVVNWWGTWPASDFHGYLVTDRMYPKLTVAKATAEPAAFEAEVFPQSLFARLADYPLVGARVAEDPRGAAEDMDRFAVAALLMGAQDYPRVTLSAVYLPGLDVYENALSARSGSGWDMAASARVADGALGYWRFLDALLEPILVKAGPRDVVIIVADPGMTKAPERVSGRRAARGFVLMAGGPVAAGRAKEPLRLVDITPAALYLLDFPVSIEMDGRVPVEAFDEAFVAAHPTRTVSTFGRLEVKASSGYSVDAELVDRLKSLGYLQ